MTTSPSYRILKLPVSRENTVFYYYKPYSKLQDSASNSLLDLPEDRTIYVCHFLREISEDFIQKYFGLVGKLKQIHLGSFRNKANKKSKRRTVYFALVVFKSPEDC